MSVRCFTVKIPSEVGDRFDDLLDSVLDRHLRELKSPTPHLISDELQYAGWFRTRYRAALIGTGVHVLVELSAKALDEAIGSFDEWANDLEVAAEAISAKGGE